jgi:UPF0755 protein
LTRRRWGALAVGAMALIVLLGGGAYWTWQSFVAPGPLTGTRIIVIPRGSGTRQVARQLAESGIVNSRLAFMAGVEIAGEGKKMQAGEYVFAAGMGGLEILHALQAGRVVIHHLTIPEGLTVTQIVALVAAADAMDGEVAAPLPQEGSLLPETYHYVWGESRADLVERMRKAMETMLADIWANRDPSTPLASPEEALTLASIVEKETALPAERRRVAAVFLNRLKRGMRLQADPTTAYAVTHGATPLGRSLTRADLDQQDPFNTYTHDGLPPGPIDNPGKAALEAVAHPAKTDELYFVADGSGGHVFARTLEEHNRNVARWRQVQHRPGDGK